MLKVAICDDNREFINKMEAHLSKFEQENAIKVKVTRFFNAHELILLFTRKKYDIVFLDIKMPEIDGFETAEIIRKKDDNVRIVFCSTFYNVPNIQKCIEVGAKDFLTKPVLYKKVEQHLNKVYNEKLISREEKLMLKTQDGVIVLQISDISYLETDKKVKSVIIHTEKKNFVTYHKLYEFERKLGDKYFCRCHSGFLVNLDYVERIKDNHIYLSGESQIAIPISKSKREIILQEMAKYIMTQTD